MPQMASSGTDNAAAEMLLGFGPKHSYFPMICAPFCFCDTEKSLESIVWLEAVTASREKS